MRISILGLGNVGRGLLHILSDERTSRTFRELTGHSLEIVTAADSSGTYLTEGLDPKSIMELKTSGRLSSTLERMGSDGMFAMEPDVIVDLSPASRDGKRELEVYKKSFSRGIAVVTANKSPLALHWKRIDEERREHNGMMFYEATVAGGLPLFSMIRGSLMPSRIIEFRGIVSLTVNMVIEKMTHGVGFEEAVRICQEEGVAEADYSDDTNGIDAARKTVILANSLFGANLSLHDLDYGGVKEATALDGWRNGSVRVISSIRMGGDGLEVYSRPEFLSPRDPLITMGEMSMGYTLKTSYSGTLTVQSAKDGPVETASAVCNDLYLAGKGIKNRQ